MAESPNFQYLVNGDALKQTCESFWSTYYSSMRALHLRNQHALSQPLKGRNNGTADAKHVSIFEQFWRIELAQALGIPQAEVGPRKVRFNEHRTKSFDVCWPLKGDPKILISIKSMQNAYRNMTNRVEEAIGDSAVLRLYKGNAVFGFFFFLLDGNVARGRADQGEHFGMKPGGERQRGIKPYLDLIEEGGDFFDLSGIADYRKLPKPPKEGVNPKKPPKPTARQDYVQRTESTLLDLLVGGPSEHADIHYDSIAFAPTCLKPVDESHWSATISKVDERLAYPQFISRLLEVARLRKFA